MNTELWNLIEAWQARQRFGVTQSALAREVGVTRSALSQWKTGKARPTPESLRSLSSVTGVSYRVLLDALLIDMGYLEKERTDGSQEERPPITRAAGSAASKAGHPSPDVRDEPKPPTTDELGLAAKRAERERDFSDQSEGE